jgi:hypothetical protein
VAGRFRLLADACVNDHLVQGLKARGWDIVRAVDLYPEATKDEMLFARAVAEGRVFVTNDRPAEAIAVRWLHEGTPFPGMIAWPVAAYEARSIGDLIEEFEELARLDDPFGPYPIRHLKAK